MSAAVDPIDDTGGFAVHAAVEHGAVRLHLHGELDLAAGPTLAAALEAHGSDTRPVILDCRDVTFVDPAGMRILLAARTAAGAAIANPGDCLERVARLAGYPSTWRAAVAVHPSPPGARGRGGPAVTAEPDRFAERRQARAARADTAQPDPPAHERAERAERADERDRLADERSAGAEQRSARADERDARADAAEAVLMARDPLVAVSDALAANERRRAANAARREQHAGRAATAASPPGARPGDDPWDADRREFVADDRELQADRRERLDDEREQLAGQRDRDMAAANPDADEGPHPTTRGPAQARQRAERAEARRSRVAAGDQRRGAPGNLLGAELVAITRAIVRSRTVDDACGDVVVAACRVVDGCDAASFSARRDGQTVTLAATSELATAVDDAQYGTGEGPCLDALARREVIHSDDLDRDARWPRFAAALRSQPVGSVVSAPVPDHDGPDVLGSLNSYGTAPGAFDADDIETVVLLTAHLAVVLSLARTAASSTRTAAQLAEAVESRDVIGQAKGILMERERMTADQAFEVLRRASQHLNRKLRDVAEDLTVTGALPPR